MHSLLISDTYFRDDVDDESSDGGIPLCRRSDWSIFCGNRRIYVQCAIKVFNIIQKRISWNKYQYIEQIKNLQLNPYVLHVRMQTKFKLISRFVCMHCETRISAPHKSFGKPNLNTKNWNQKTMIWKCAIQRIKLNKIKRRLSMLQEYTS